MAARHFKYTYNSEIPPKTVLSRMLRANIDNSYFDNNESNRMNMNIERNRIYFSRRKELKNLMKSVNSHIDNNSQTFFLTLYYMDLIFTNKDLEKVFYSHFMTWNNYTSFNDIQMNNYALLSLACLIVASKFNENDPHVPTMSSYLRLLYEYSKKKYIFNLDSLYMAEVVVLKLLKYKLNYYTIYHYLIFFFTHGIIFKKTIENSKIFQKYSERKILEKIYIQSREILDGIIEPQKYFHLYYGKNNYKIVVEIFLWSIEHIMNISIKDYENIFKLVFNINIDEIEHKEINVVIEEIYKSIKKKNNSGNISTRMGVLNANIKNSTNYTQVPDSISQFSTRPQSKEINFQYIEQKPSCPNVSSFSNSKASYLIPPQVNTGNYYHQYFKGLVHNELDRFNSNYQHKVPYPYHPNPIPHSSKGIKESQGQQSNISYGPNNRIYLTSKKTDHKLNSIDNTDISVQKKNHPLLKSSKQFDIENEPIDTDEMHYKNKINKPFDNIEKIENSSRKIIIIKEPEQNRKKSLSCSKNNINSPQYNYNNYNYNCQSRPYMNINNNNNISPKLKIEDNIKKVNELNSQKKLNNFYYIFTPNNNNNINKKIGEENLSNQIILKQFKSSNIDFYPTKILKGNILSDKKVTKFIDDNAIIKPEDIPESVINQNLKLEPQDNKRGYSNKYYYDSGIKNNININNNYNKPNNTIIINNNFHINTFIDKKDLRINPNLQNKSKTSKNLASFNEKNENNINKMNDELSYDGKYRIIRIKKKNTSEIKNGRNIIDKNSIILSN